MLPDGYNAGLFATEDIKVDFAEIYTLMNVGRRNSLENPSKPHVNCQ
jgi:hypothetical protein